MVSLSYLGEILVLGYFDKIHPELALYLHHKYVRCLFKFHPPTPHSNFFRDFVLLILKDQRYFLYFT